MRESSFNLANGGAIAIGHPLGASGAGIMTTLLNALERRGGRYGLQTMSEGGGIANATKRLQSPTAVKATAQGWAS